MEGGGSARFFFCLISCFCSVMHFVTSVGAISISAAQTPLIDDVMLTRVEYGGALLIGQRVAHKALFFL
jgi:hypothetical protein